MRFKATITFFLLGLSFTLSSLYSQELHVYYNLYNDNITYKLDGEELEEPKLRNGQVIQLHFTEFNNFLYDLEVEYKQEDVMTSSGFMEVAQLAGLSPGLPGLGMGIGGERMGTSGGLGIMDMPMLSINDTDITISSLISDLFGGSRGSAQMLEQANSTMAEISALREEISQLRNDILSYQKSREVAIMALAHVDSLKRHPNLQPSFIKARCMEYYKEIFLTDEGATMSLDELLETQKIPGRHATALNNLMANEKALGTKVKRLSSLNEQLVNLAVDDADYLKYVANLQSFRKDAQSFSRDLKGAVAETQSMPDYPTKEELANLQFSLAEVISNDFTYHSRTQSHSDILNIDVRLVKKGRTVGQEAEVVKSRHLSLEAKGGLKITASVGLNFSRFFDPDQTYSVRNNVIVGEDAGAFAPAATSLIHFYSYNGKKVSLGGTFGIGFPLLAGADESQSLQFFVGPSLIFGNKQRMILNFGIMGGRATRLDRGYEIGDEFDINLGDIPTRNPYELGLFIGTSFNLMGN